MQTIALHLPTPDEAVQNAAQSQPPVNNVITAGGAALLDRLELESLILNIDASLRIYARHQFFTWTQGLLQGLIKHEALICALRGSEAASFNVDSFATSAVEPSTLSDSFCQDTSMVPNLIRAWEDHHFRPVAYEATVGSGFPNGALARALTKIDTDIVFAHGTSDVFGKLASLFCFACRSETVGPNQLYFVELIVPFVHLAWTRVRIGRPTDVAGATAAGVGLLTPREQEILKWMHIGKSNMEIGLILEISPLTVKNHVQNILRKLDVQNRTQAVAKGLALRILNL